MHTGNARLDRRKYRRKRELKILILECVGANGRTIIHTGTGNGDPEWTKCGTGLRR